MWSTALLPQRRRDRIVERVRRRPRRSALGFIVMHLRVLGILCCIAIYPIFGRPKTASSPALSQIPSAPDAEDAATIVRADFGKHIDALGELLELTEDRQYARDRVSYYHEHVSRDSGASHRTTSHRDTK